MPVSASADSPVRSVPIRTGPPPPRWESPVGLTRWPPATAPTLAALAQCCRPPLPPLGRHGFSHSACADSTLATPLPHPRHTALCTDRNYPGSTPSPYRLGRRSPTAWPTPTSPLSP